MVVGTQVLALGLCAHAYGTYFMGERDPWFDRMRARFRLEHGLLLGGAFMLVGLAFGAVIVATWISHGFGSLADEHLAVVAATLLIVGIQIFFSSFLLTILGPPSPVSATPSGVAATPTARVGSADGHSASRAEARSTRGRTRRLVAGGDPRRGHGRADPLAAGDPSRLLHRHRQRRGAQRRGQPRSRSDALRSGPRPARGHRSGAARGVRPPPALHSHVCGSSRGGPHRVSHDDRRSRAHLARLRRRRRSRARPSAPASVPATVCVGPARRADRARRHDRPAGESAAGPARRRVGFPTASASGSCHRPARSARCSHRRVRSSRAPRCSDRGSSARGPIRSCCSSCCRSRGRSRCCCSRARRRAVRCALRGRMLRPAVAIALIAFANAASWALITPSFNAPDEPDHFAYAQYFAETGHAPARVPDARRAVLHRTRRWRSTPSTSTRRSRSPTGARRGWRSTSATGNTNARSHPHPAGQRRRLHRGGLAPPAAYYALLAPAYVAVRSQSTFSQLTAMRLTSALLGALVAAVRVRDRARAAAAPADRRRSLPGCSSPSSRCSASSRAPSTTTTASTPPPRCRSTW